MCSDDEFTVILKLCCGPYDDFYLNEMWTLAQDVLIVPLLFSCDVYFSFNCCSLLIIIVVKNHLWFRWEIKYIYFLMF